MENYFSGVGVKKQAKRALPWADNAQLDKPEHYTCIPSTAAAVNTTLLLGKPLLITGEPGCGKSRLAHRVAWELNFAEDNPLQVTVKSTTEASDLFYNYDTVGRFYAAQVAHKVQQTTEAPEKYLRFCGLGLAILRAKGREKILADDKLKKLGDAATLDYIPEQPQRSIVLIDEIDKAPREVPNDILDEIEAMRFTIPELGILEAIGLDDDDKEFLPIVFITNNSERDLPDAFLRRCLFHHLEFPPFNEADIEKGDKAEQITIADIVNRRFLDRYIDTPVVVRDALRLCQFLRANDELSRKPNLAEMILFIDYCLSAFPDNLQQPLIQQNQQRVLHALCTLLLKSPNDSKQGEDLLQAWHVDNA